LEHVSALLMAMYLELLLDWPRAIEKEL
jgi:hypothetical protein